MEITFGTDGWRAKHAAITPTRLRAIAGGVMRVLSMRGIDSPSLVVGYDARKHAGEYASILARAITDAGGNVILATRDCPTPAVASTIQREQLDGGLMVTASHNPPDYCGVKFIAQGGAPALPETTDAIENALGAPQPATTPGTQTESDLITPYVKTVCDRVGADLSGLTVVYDAMHGSGRGVTDRALVAAGAEVHTRRCTRDPTFDGGAPNPTPDRLQAVTDRVQDSQIDLGIATDGDADRVAVITSDGVIDANRLFAVLYTYLLHEESGPAVRTVSTTALIDQIARDHDTTVIETPVGFKWVAQAMTEHDAVLGGEESGGFTIRNHVPNKDGTLIGLLAAAAAVDTPLETRLAEIQTTYGAIHADRVSVDCPEDHKEPAMDAIENNVPETIAGTAVASVNRIDGLKLMLTTDAWVLLRPSGTEPKLRVYAEAGTDTRCQELLAAGRQLAERYVEAN